MGKFQGRSHSILRKLLTKTVALLFAVLGFVLITLTTFRLINPDPFVAIKGRVTKRGEVVTNQIVKIDSSIEITTNEKGVFFIGSLPEGKHTFYIKESLKSKPILKEIDLKEGDSKTLIIKLNEPDLPVGEDSLTDEDLIAATELWSRDNSNLYYINSVILADMLSPETISLAYNIGIKDPSESTLIKLISFEQRNFAHLDDFVLQDTTKEYTTNEIWGSDIINGTSTPLYIIEIPEIAHNYQYLYGVRAFACEGFAIFNVAMLRLLGFDIDQVTTISLSGKVGHQITLANIQDKSYLFSNQYIHTDTGKGATFSGRINAEEPFEFLEHGLDLFANDYYNVFTPEVIINNMDIEHLKDIYENLSKITDEEILIISEENEDYAVGEEPLITFEEYASFYTESPDIFYPELKTKTNNYQNWVEFFNALRQEIWKNSKKYYDSPYTLAKYNSRSLFVTKPEIYAKASLKGVKLKEVAETLSTVDGAINWIKNNITNETFTQPSQILLADEVIVFGAGNPQDKALLAFSILKLKGIPSEILIGNKNSYLLTEVQNKKETFDMNTLTRITQIPEEPIIVFDDTAVFYPKNKRYDALPIAFESLVVPTDNYLSTDIPTKIGKDTSWWKLDWYFGLLGCSLVIGTAYLFLVTIKDEK